MHIKTPSGDFSASQLQKVAAREYNKQPNRHEEPLDLLSHALPFGSPPDVAGINGTAYLTAQTLVQQVAYTLSDKLFTYSPESFCLDDAAKLWASRAQLNARGYATTIEAMEARLGAASVLLGYVFSSDSGLQKKQVSQTIIASSATLALMRSALDQLSLLYSLSSPFVAHVAAVDYDFVSGKLVTDYVAPITIAQETGTGLVASFSPYEAQHMALFATLAAMVLPTIHVYDGVCIGRASTKVSDILDQTGLHSIFSSVASENVGKADASTKVSRILASLNAELGTEYELFEYEGHAEPDAVAVVFGSVESSLAKKVATNLAKSGRRVGIIAVRVYRPFAEDQFLDAIPRSVKRIVVLGQVQDNLAVQDHTLQSALYSDVLAAITMSDVWNLPPPILDVKYSRGHVWHPKEFAWIFDQALQKPIVSITIPREVIASEASTLDLFDFLPKERDSRRYVFWDSDGSTSAPAAAVVARVLADNRAKYMAFSAIYDNVPIAGTLYSEIRTSTRPIEVPFFAEGADVSFIGDLRLLDKFDVVAGTVHGGAIILQSDIRQETLENRVPAGFLQAIAKKNLAIYVLNPSVVTGLEEKVVVENVLVQLAFLRIADVNVALDRLGTFNFNTKAVQETSEKLAEALIKVEALKKWSATDMDIQSGHGFPDHPTNLIPNSFAPNNEKHLPEISSLLTSWQSAAQALAFKEAFSLRTALRPDLTTKTHIVTVRENKRLTPATYDRNIFHIEFDLHGTGLTYQIGEALGVHAHNDIGDVNEFISWYGIDSNDLVKVPSRDNPEDLEVRTIFQALQQNIDIFGRPPKKFYEALSEFTINEDEKKRLLTLCSPDGVVEFKWRAEVDTITYVDVLRENPGAHPTFQELLKIIPPLKRREYSIASAQAVNPDSVHLMIVAVNWVDPKGRGRFGQATRYLSGLSVGAEVVVSVKPSVMKLPTQSTRVFLPILYSTTDCVNPR